MARFNCRAGPPIGSTPAITAMIGALTLASLPPGEAGAFAALADGAFSTGAAAFGVSFTVATGTVFGAGGGGAGFAGGTGADLAGALLAGAGVGLAFVAGLVGGDAFPGTVALGFGGLAFATFLAGAFTATCFTGFGAAFFFGAGAVFLALAAGFADFFAAFPAMAGLALALFEPFFASGFAFPAFCCFFAFTFAMDPRTLGGGGKGKRIHHLCKFRMALILCATILYSRPDFPGAVAQLVRAHDS